MNHKPKSPNSLFQCLKHWVHVVFVFMVKLKWFMSKAVMCFGGACFGTLRASEDSGLNPGKRKQIFNSHVNGVFSTSRDRQESASLSLVLRLQLPSPPHLLLLLLYDHTLRVMAMFWSSRDTKVAKNPTLHFHVVQVLASSQNHDCRPLFVLYLDSTISPKTSRPQPC